MCFFVGYVSYRNAENGSVFIQTLCKELREHGKKRELRRIIDSVIDEVLKDKVYIQVPAITYTLTKPYVFGDYFGDRNRNKKTGLQSIL